MEKNEGDICKKIAARLYNNINFLKECAKKTNYHELSFERTIELFETYVSEIENISPSEIKEKIFYVVWEGKEYRIVLKNGESESILGFLEQIGKDGREDLKELLLQFEDCSHENFQVFSSLGGEKYKFCDVCKKFV